MAKSRIDYKGKHIRIYDDRESYCLLIINDDGVLKKICYDDNFYSAEDYYYNVISLMLKYYYNDENDDDFQKEKIAFEKHLFKQGVSLDDLESCRDYYEYEKERSATIKEYYEKGEQQ